MPQSFIPEHFYGKGYSFEFFAFYEKTFLSRKREMTLVKQNKGLTGQARTRKK